MKAKTARTKLILALAPLAGGLFLPSVGSASLGSASGAISALSAQSAYQATDLFLTSEIQRRIRSNSAVTQAKIALASESSDLDSDNTLEARAMLASIAGYTPPTGGGFVPADSIAPKTDGHGMPLGYCAWDNGTTTATAGFIAGDSPATNVSVSFAIIASGKDRSFNTSCADALSGSASGDDILSLATVGESNLGVASNLYLGRPVSSFSALNALDTTNTEPGEMRMVLDEGVTYAWLDLNGDGTYQWEGVGSKSHFYAGDSNGATAGGEYSSSPFSVGIGARFSDTSQVPVEALEVDGNALFRNGNDANTTVIIESDPDNAGGEEHNPRLIFKQDGGGFESRIGLTGSAGVEYTDSIVNAAYLEAATNALQFVTGRDASNAASVGAARMTIMADGKIGIGTTNPSQSLDVVGTTKTEKVLINSHTGTLDGLTDAYMTVDRVGEFGTERGLLLRMDGDGHGGDWDFDSGDDVAIELQSDPAGVSANATTKFRLFGDGSMWTSSDIRSLGSIHEGDLSLDIRGTGQNRLAPAYYKENGVQQNSSNLRGLSFIVYNPDGTRVSAQTYDTYSFPAESDALAAAIDAMTVDQIGVLYSWDAFESNITQNLRDSASQMGLIKLANAYLQYPDGTLRDQRIPYAAIFQKGSVGKAYEATGNDDTNGLYAQVRATIDNGTFYVENSGTSVAGLQNRAGEYKAFINQDEALETENLVTNGVASFHNDAWDTTAPTFHLVGSFEDNRSVAAMTNDGYTLKTNIDGPSSGLSTMNKIHVEGYGYEHSEVVDFTVVFYAYGAGNSITRVGVFNHGRYSVSLIELAEGPDGKIWLRFGPTMYQMRFHVSLYSSFGAHKASSAQGWTLAVDQGTLSGMSNYVDVNQVSNNTYVMATSASGEDDFMNSPISIREREFVANSTTDDRYSPNINFHWGGRISRSLWMDSAGTLNYGGYFNTGEPTSNGRMRLKTFEIVNDSDYNPVIIKSSVGPSASSVGGYTIYPDGDSTQRTEYSAQRGGNFRIWTSAANTSVIWSSGNNVHVRGSLFQNSDRKLKKNISGIDGALASLRQVQGRTYNWKTDKTGSALKYGVIAQELESVFPDMVATAEDGTKSVTYEGLIPVLVEATKELDDKVEDNTNSIVQMKTKMSEQKERIDYLENLVEQSQSEVVEIKKTDKASKTTKVTDQSVPVRIDARDQSVMSRFYQN